MAELLKRALELLLKPGLRSYVAAVLALASFVFIWLPRGITRAMGLVEWQADYRPLGAVVLIFSICTLLVEGGFQLVSLVKRKAQTQRDAKRHKTQFECLTRGERNVLRSCLVGDHRALKGCIFDLNFASLESSGMLRRASREDGNYALYAVEEWVWQYLREHPGAIDVKRQGDKYIDPRL